VKEELSVIQRLDTWNEGGVKKRIKMISVGRGLGAWVKHRGPT
jgi:hypothetical protein